MTLANLAIKCWICGGDANSREHSTKKSDIKSIFGTPSQKEPLFLHNDQQKNIKIGSLDSERLKSPAKICQNCNTARTQPHDRAWEVFSPAMRSILSRPERTKAVRANSIFKYDTCQMMLNIHLYFVKLFGCYALEGKLAINLAPFATAIINGKAHQSVYLRFCRIEPRVGRSNVMCQNRDDGTCAFATWFYEIENLAVNVMYAEPDQKRKGLVNAWHPRFGTNKLLISDSP